jgi:hypothetical protein
MLAGLAASCHRGGDENLGLKTEAQAPVAVDRLTEADALLAALRQPMGEVERKLGARGMELAQTLELAGDDHGHARTDRIDEVVHLDTDGEGGFHLVRELDHPLELAPAPKPEDSLEPAKMVDPAAQGMEAIEIEGRWFVRDRYGRFVERRPEPGELDRVRNLGERVLGDDVALLLPFCTIEDRGSGELLGRKTKKLALSLRAQPADRASETDPRRAWRAEMTVASLSGTLELDAATGAPLAATLEARYRVPGKKLDVRLVLKQEARAAVALAAPTEAIVAPHRPRPTVERNQLLDGLAPPVGTQGGHS